MATPAIAATIATLAFPAPTLSNPSVLLFVALPLWAEAIVVPPRHAGWPSSLLALLPFVVVTNPPQLVVLAALMALAVRTTRRLTLGQWSVSQQAFEIGAWSLACVLAAVMSWQVQKALQASSLQELLFDPRRGEAGVLIRASSWTLAVVIASLVVGGLGARLAGHRLSELALLTWLVRGLARAIAVAGFVYGVIAVCDVTLGEAGPPVVALLLAAGLAWLAWRSRQRRHRIEVLIGYVAVVEAKDSTAGHHLTDVSSRTARIADELNLPARTIDDYGCGALLHDLGKLAACMHVLTKPTNLDPEEQAQMRAHTTIGRDLLSVLPGFATAAAIAGHNHERWDGQGYPDALAGSIFHFPRGSWPSWTPSTR